MVVVVVVVTRLARAVPDLDLFLRDGGNVDAREHAHKSLVQPGKVFEAPRHLPGPALFVVKQTAKSRGWEREERRGEERRGDERRVGNGQKQNAMLRAYR